ncbi:MAG TPA: GNAT family N-acetyltransferase [Flavisolibacter sp.]|nr:GNAT family N-acetyltransferase [Flavisolibacter sp.]
MVELRMATVSDAREILDIYAPYILDSAFTFENELPPLEQFAGRIETCTKKFPWIVCEIDGTIAGYVYASPHRDRDAYQWTCECSVYVHSGFHGKGLARELYSILFSMLKVQGLRSVYAGITLPNEPSVRLHESCGFEWFVTYDNVGYKLGSWHKVGWWRLQLNDFDLQPSPPLKLPDLDPGLYQTLFTQAARRIGERL